MTPSGSVAKKPVGRPRVRVSAEEVQRLRNQGRSWRQTARALGIGTATAMRLLGSLATEDFNGEKARSETRQSFD